MPVRYKKLGGRGRHFIAAWRRYRGLSQQQVGERIEMSKANLSRIETGDIPYTQDVLEALADALSTDPASLLSRDPTDPEGVWAVWETISVTDRPRAIEILKALASPAGGIKTNS